MLASVNPCFFFNMRFCHEAEREESFRPKDFARDRVRGSKRKLRGSSAEGWRKLRLKTSHAADTPCLAVNVCNMCLKKETP